MIGRRRVRHVLLALVAAVVFPACASDGDDASPRAATTTTATASTSTSPTSTTTTSTSTSTTAPSTTTTTTVPDPVTYRRGDEGPDVRTIQSTLRDLGYWVGEIDGKFGHQTAQAVLAFQKVEGFGRDGQVGPLTAVAMLDAVRPTPRFPERDGVEIDLERQVLFIVRGGVVTEIHNTSTGRAGWRTRAGTFTVRRQIDGMRHAPLGDLWRPKYFDDGIAMHGSGSIPAHPASHGCARLSNAAINHVWDDGLVPIGTPVSVYA